MEPSFSNSAWRSRLEGGALLAVIALLGILAVMQHRWLGAIAEAERRKLGEEAKEKASATAQDIDRELTRVFLELRIDGKAAAARDGAAYSEQFEQWRSRSPHSALVKSVFVAQRSEAGPRRLLRFDPPSRTFVEERWPDSLAKVRATVDSGGDFPLSLPLSPSLPPVMAEIPAFVSPIMNVVVDARESPGGGSAPRLTQIRQMFMRHTGVSPVQIVLLDADYLKQRLVGGTALSRLGTSGPFDWTVVRTADGTVVAGAPSAATASPDSTSPLLRLRFDDLEQSLLRGVLPGLSDVISESSVKVMVQVAGPPGAALVNASSSGSGPSTAPWTLTLRHREGSIDQAVRAQQLRNTALSASILGVLGLSAGLVFFSARRLRALATQQVEFVAAVSHELRTPLAVIRSAADNLADGVVHDGEHTKRYGALIRDESVRLTDMVEHVLEFAGADSPARTARAPIDVKEAVKAAVSGMSALATERGARLEVETFGESLLVSGDMSHLTRAISNLLGNALKYGGDAPRVTIRVQREADGVVIGVADQGGGLSASEIPRLFEPFYRGQRASEAQIPGSGLGLALVKRIIESHGGRVSASNRADGGALFTVVLPTLGPGTVAVPAGNTAPA